MTFDGKAFGAEIVGVVKGFLQKELRTVVERLDALERRFDGLPAPVDLSSDLAALKATVEAIPAAVGPTLALPDIPGMVSEAVAKSVSEIPVAKDGANGAGMAGAIIDRDGNLILTMTNGETKNLGSVVGKDGEPGKAGRDGFNLEDFDASVMDDGRTVLLSFTAKEMDYKIELGFPVMLYRGVWREGDYERGDTVTLGGSLWHCNAVKTAEKPGEASKDWTLCAKKGRDGKDGVMTPEKSVQPVRVGVPAKGG